MKANRYSAESLLQRIRSRKIDLDTAAEVESIEKLVLGVKESTDEIEAAVDALRSAGAFAVAAVNSTKEHDHVIRLETLVESAVKGSGKELVLAQRKLRISMVSGFFAVDSALKRLDCAHTQFGKAAALLVQELEQVKTPLIRYWLQCWIAQEYKIEELVCHYARADQKTLPDDFRAYAVEAAEIFALYEIWREKRLAKSSDLKLGVELGLLVPPLCLIGLEHGFESKVDGLKESLQEFAATLRDFTASYADEVPIDLEMVRKSEREHRNYLEISLMNDDFKAAKEFKERNGRYLMRFREHQVQRQLRAHDRDRDANDLQKCMLEIDERIQMALLTRAHDLAPWVTAAANNLLFAQMLLNKYEIVAENFRKECNDAHLFEMRAHVYVCETLKLISKLPVQ